MAPNAESMIAANQARVTPELRAAGRRPIDQEATDEMKEGEAQGLVEGEGQVVAWRVRGPFVVVVSEDDDGRLVKEAHPRKGKEKQAERAMRTGRGMVQEAGESRGEAREERREERQERQRRPRPTQ
jgi:hypothetical protein